LRASITISGKDVHITEKELRGAKYENFKQKKTTLLNDTLVK
jgi:hypothetical protein